MGDPSKSTADQWRALLIRSFLVGAVVTALTLFLLQDVEGGLYLVIRLTVQTVASCVLGGAMVGVILPLMAVESVGLHAALAAVVGSVAYFFLYHLAVPPFFPYMVFDVIGNLAGAAIGGFLGGVAGSSVKRLRR